MSDETNNQETPATPQAPEVPVQPAPQQAPPQQEAAQPIYANPTAQQPQYQQQPYLQPVPGMTYLSGGMKFGWLVVGFLLGIGGILIAWLTNAGKYPQVKSDAVKFSIIGFAINFILIALAYFMFFGLMFAATGVMSSTF